MSADASIASQAGTSADATRLWRVFYAIGAVVGIGLVATYAALPESRAATHPATIHVGAFFGAMIGFYIVAGAMLARSACRDAARLADLPEARRAALAGEVALPARAWLLGFTVFCVGFHLSVIAQLDVRVPALSDPAVLLTRLGFSHVLGWVHALCLAAWWALMFTQAFAFQRVARELPRVDLVDHTDLAPFVRVGLRLALVAALAAALTAAFHVDWGAGSLAPQMLLGVPVSLLTVASAFALPLWGTHVRLRDERGAELRRVHAALRGEPGALGDSPLVREGEELGTVELLAYRAHIQSLGTWPVDASALARLGLYLGIPLVGWVGGALVERMLDALLD
jgi:hypothetical protein